MIKHLVTDWELTRTRMINQVLSQASIFHRGNSCLWGSYCQHFLMYSGIKISDHPPSYKTEIQNWAQITADVCPRLIGCQRAVSLASRWDVHSARPFTLAHNATKVWWLSNLLKQAPWQSHGFTPGPQSLHQRKLHPPQIPTQIKHADDITVSPVFFFKKHPSGPPLLACAV